VEAADGPLEQIAGARDLKSARDFHAEYGFTLIFMSRALLSLSRGVFLFEALAQ